MSKEKEKHTGPIPTPQKTAPPDHLLNTPLNSQVAEVLAGVAGETKAKSASPLPSRWRHTHGLEDAAGQFA